MQRWRPGRTRTVRSNLQPPPGPDPARGARPWRRRPSAHLADNRLKTTKYTALSFLPKNLFEQFHRLANVYFVFIALLNFVPAVNAFQPGLALAPVLFILAATAIKDLWEDYSRHRSDQDINHLGCLVFSRCGARLAGTGGSGRVRPGQDLWGAEGREWGLVPDQPLQAPQMSPKHSDSKADTQAPLQAPIPTPDE